MAKEIERATALARRLAGELGDDLIAVAVYGSAARGEYREGVSDVNVLVVVRGLEPRHLRAASPAAREWVKEGNPAPLMLSESDWRGSADVFAIEYADVRDAHRVVHGEDLFTDLEIRWADLRLQTERELREKSLQLREGYLLTAGAPEELGELLRRSCSTFVALFRAALRLDGADAPRDSAGVVRAIAERAGFDPEPWLEVLRARNDGKRLAPGAEAPLVTGYLAAVAATVRWLDGLERGRSPSLV